MIRLMTISELDQVVDLVPTEQRETYKEVLPHLNVYVYDHDGMKGFTYILEGYFIGAVHTLSDKDPVVTKELISFLKERYDELLIHVAIDDKQLEDTVLSLGFELDGLSEEDQNLREYSYLSE